MIINETIDTDMHKKNKRQDTFNFFSPSMRLFISGFRHPHSSIKVLTPSGKKLKNLFFITCVDINPSRQNHQIEALFIHMNGYQILPFQNSKRSTYIKVSSFKLQSSYQSGFSCISGLWHLDPCTKVSTPCFSCISGLQHLVSLAYRGYDTLIPVPRFRHLVSLAYRGYDTLIPAPRLRHLVSLAYRGYGTLIPAPRLRHLVSLAYRGYDTLIPAPRFRHLVSLTYRGYDTLIPAPRFWNLIFSCISGLRHLDLCTKVLTSCFSCILGLRHSDPCTKVSTPCPPLLSQGYDTLPRLWHLIPILFSSWPSPLEWSHSRLKKISKKRQNLKNIFKKINILKFKINK